MWNSSKIYNVYNVELYIQLCSFLFQRFPCKECNFLLYAYDISNFSISGTRPISWYPLWSRCWCKFHIALPINELVFILRIHLFAILFLSVSHFSPETKKSMTYSKSKLYKPSFLLSHRTPFRSKLVKVKIRTLLKLSAKENVLIVFVCNAFNFFPFCTMVTVHTSRTLIVVLGVCASSLYR